MRHLLAGALALAALLCAPAMAATQPAFCTNSFGQTTSCTPSMPVDQTGTALGTDANPLRTKLPAGGSSTSGGLLPGQASPVTPAPVALAASTATQIDSGFTTVQRNGSLLVTVQLETSPSAILYLCFAGQTNCSATVHDKIIAAGAAAGADYTAPFGFTGAIYAYSTSAVTLTVSRWIAQ